MSIGDEHTIMVRWGTAGLFLVCETHPAGNCAWIHHVERWGYDAVLHNLGKGDWLRYVDKTVVHEVGGLRGFCLGPAPTLAERRPADVIAQVRDAFDELMNSNRGGSPLIDRLTRDEWSIVCALLVILSDAIKAEPRGCPMCAERGEGMEGARP